MISLTVLILLILLAFLQPIWKQFGAEPLGQQRRTVVVLFDHSLSMEHVDDGVSAAGIQRIGAAFGFRAVCSSRWRSPRSCLGSSS